MEQVDGNPDEGKWARQFENHKLAEVFTFTHAPGNSSYMQKEEWFLC